MIKILLSFFLVFFSIQLQNPSEWELKKDQDYVKVYVRDLDTHLKEFLGETIVNQHIDSVYSFIMDFDHAYQWMYKVKSSKRISPLNEKNFYVYFTVNINWPLTDRDLVMEVTKDIKEGIKIITLDSRPKFVPEDKDYVRIIDSKSIWTLEYVDKKRTKVFLQSHSDIQGIPSWITDLFITQTPFYGLKNLRKRFN